MPNNSRPWNLNITNTLIVITYLAVTAVFASLALAARTNTENIGNLRVKTEVNSEVVKALVRDLPTIKTQLASVDGRLIRLETHFGTLPKEAKMGDVLIKWKIRSAIMTDFGAIARIPGDQDTMERVKAMDLAKCGVVEILGKPSDVVNSAAEIVEDEDET